MAQIVNGFVFNFQQPSQIVSRQMFYLSQGLREDWLQEYLRGIQRVSPQDVHQVFQAHVKPEEMIILILGNPEAFDAPPETLGRIHLWDVETGRVQSNPQGPSAIGSRREGPQSPR